MPVSQELTHLFEMIVATKIDNFLQEQSLLSINIKYDRGIAHLKDFAIQSWTAGLNSFIFWLDREGCTRLVNKMTTRPDSGSIQKEVPVNPRCPTDRVEKKRPAEEPVSDGVSNPATRVRPGCFFTKAATTFGSRIRVGCCSMACKISRQRR
jgi:hypothetical protein